MEGLGIGYARSMPRLSAAVDWALLHQSLAVVFEVGRGCAVSHELIFT